LSDITLNNAVLLVQNYLNAMELRDLNSAQKALSTDIIMIFPGNKIFHNLDEVTNWAKLRYNWIKKSYDSFDSLMRENMVIVYCYGMLRGEWHNGIEFSNIRFIDRFSIQGDRIVKQMVWNDLGEFNQKL
jgi:hypothetical protein